MLTLQLVFQIKFAPYISPKLDVAETLLTISLVGFCFCGMAFSWGDFKKEIFGEGTSAHSAYNAAAWIMIAVGCTVSVLGLADETFERL